MQRLLKLQAAGLCIAGSPALHIRRSCSFNGSFNVATGASNKKEHEASISASSPFSIKLHVMAMADAGQRNEHNNEVKKAPIGSKSPAEQLTNSPSGCKAPGLAEAPAAPAHLIEAHIHPGDGMLHVHERMQKKQSSTLIQAIIQQGDGISTQQAEEPSAPTLQARIHEGDGMPDYMQAMQLSKKASSSPAAPHPPHSSSSKVIDADASSTATIDASNGDVPPSAHHGRRMLIQMIIAHILRKRTGPDANVDDDDLERIRGGDVSSLITLLNEAGAKKDGLTNDFFAVLNSIDADDDASMEKQLVLFTNKLEPIRWHLEESFKRSLGSKERLALHAAKLRQFRGRAGPDPDPNWIPQHLRAKLLQLEDTSIRCGFNPLFDILWVPWAKSVEYYHHSDVSMTCCRKAYLEGMSRKELASLLFSWATPTRPVLEYMVSRAPEGKIVEIGSGHGYWAQLLRQMGADVVAVDNEPSKLAFFPDSVIMDGVAFVKQGCADDRALFFCWPWQQKGVAPPPLDVAACINAYNGSIVFFVGEKHRGCTFDMAAWMCDHKMQGWHLEKEMEMPCWPDAHDVFMCFVKRHEPALKAGSNGHDMEKVEEEQEEADGDVDLVQFSKKLAKQRREEFLEAMRMCNIQ